MASGRALAPRSSAAARARDLRGLLRSPSASARQPLEALAVGAEADHDQPRAGTSPSTSGHAATSRSTPLETISLPTNATSRSWRGPARPAPACGGSSRAKASTPPLRLASRHRPPGAMRVRPAATAASGGSRGANSFMSTPAGRAGCVGSRSRRQVPPTGSPPCDGSPPARRSPREALAGERRKALGFGLDEYSRALPWTFTA